MADTKLVDNFTNKTTGDKIEICDTEARTLAEQNASEITDLYETLTELIETTGADLSYLLEDISGFTYGSNKIFYASRTGNVVTLYFGISGMFTGSGEITLFTLPEGYRPLYNMYHTYNTQTGIPAILQLRTDGGIRLGFSSSVTLPTTESYLLRQIITYVVS